MIATRKVKAIVGASLALLTATVAACGSSGSGKEVFINSSGGTLDEINRTVYWDPFQKSTGIKVINSAPVDLAKLKAMVETNNVQWDITELDNGDIFRAAKQGLLQKLDLSKLPTGTLVKGSYNDYGVWQSPYSTVLVWNTKKWPLSGKHPTSMMDLWNQKDFPGKRCIEKTAVDNLELGSLMAGAARDAIYPIDTAKAYGELDKLKKDVSVYWTTGAQSVQSVVDGECDMGTTWSGRPYQLAQTGGASLGVAWGDAILHVSYWVVPKGAKNVGNAMKLLAWMLKPDLEARQATKTGYPGPVKGLEKLLPQKVVDYLPTSAAHLAVSVQASDDWWVANGDKAEQQFLSWLTK